MRNIYKIDKYEFVHNNLHFSLNDNVKEIQIQPAGQIIADSDQLAFIYLVEEGDGYSYLQFPESIWPQLVELLKSEENPILIINDQHIELINFTEELQMLLFNIEGNENYGIDFVNAVESAFAEIYKNTSNLE